MNKPNIKLSVFVVILLPILVSLGFWQLDRADQKRQLLADFDAKRGQQPIAIDQALKSVSKPQDWKYLPVVSQGSFDQEHVFLLDNQVFKGRVGYEIITPFLSESGHWFYVSRGWIAGNPDRRILPSIPAINGNTQITAEVYVPSGKSVVLSDEIFASGWPKVSQSVDVDAMNRMLNIDAFPYVLRLTKSSPGVLTRHWQIVNILPEKHTAYAVQWFAMALVLVGLFIWTLFKSQKRSTDTTE